MSTAARPAKPQGIWAAVLLPIGRQGEIEWDALAEQVAVLAESGVAGVYTNGTAGEFHSQTEAEFERITEIVVGAAARARLPVQIGASHTNGRVSRDRLSRLRDLPISAVQFILPDWWAPGPEESARFVAGLSDAAPSMPLVLYNPPHAKARLEPEDIARLKRHAPNLIGAKLPGGDASWYGRMRATLPDLAVFIPGHHAATGRKCGAAGSYSNIACLSPAGAAAWWRQAATDPEAALLLETRVRRFVEEAMLPLRSALGLSDAALDKAMAAAGGFYPVSSRLLWPYHHAPDDAVAAIAAAARQDLPEFFR